MSGEHSLKILLLRTSWQQKFLIFICLMIFETPFTSVIEITIDLSLFCFVSSTFK